MKQLVSLKEAEELLARGAGLPANALLTPAARDLWESRRASASAPTASAPKAAAPVSASGPLVPISPKLPDEEFRWTPGSDPKTAAEMAAFYASPAILKLRQKICQVGRRVWEREYVDGNGGNIVARIGDNFFLCTPTLMSKGLLEPDDICIVDWEGKQYAGRRPRTSEVFTHLAIYKATPQCKATVHAHPPHATAFAVAAVEPPTCMIPEAEVFLGKIGYAKYYTPGTPANAQAVGEVAKDHQAIIMENHGVIVWGKDLEDAYWKMENTDAYCKTVWVASQLGKSLKTFTTKELKDLMAIRMKLGMPEMRKDWKECELCDNSDFQPGVVCATPAPAAALKGDTAVSTEAAEAIVKQVTDLILQRLK